MARGLNKVMVIGTVGRDPEMRYTSAGKAVTNFSVGTTRSWQSSDGQRNEHTEWFNVVAWGGLAEVCHQHLGQGRQIYIEGRMQTRRWEDDVGHERTTTELIAREMIMLDAPVDGQSDFDEHHEQGE